MAGPRLTTAAYQLVNEREKGTEGGQVVIGSESRGL
jgi:hypothetical protein